MNNIFEDIPGNENWKSVEFVDKGWSEDRKYHIITNDGENLLLRVSDINKYEEKKKEFAVLHKLSDLNFTMSKAYKLGICNKGVYMLLSWICGDDMEQTLENIDFSNQYRLGYEAGVILKKIHSLDIEFNKFSWKDKFNKKIDRNIKMYEDCPLKYDNGHKFIEYINSSRHLLKNRPLVLHHGDYHVGNMIYSEEGHVCIIDFNRFDFGDPWEEFNRIVWDVHSSHAFATGRIDGYFDDCVPREFFELLALYISSNTLSSLPWAISFGNSEVKTMLDQAAEILDFYDDFKNIIPSWYTETKKKQISCHGK